MEFWNDEVTEKSWQVLKELTKEIDFVLIGGWAVYLYTKLHKSKDIDIIVDYPVLRELQVKYTLNKNERLKKYEIKLPEGFDIDIYVPNYSKLALPVKDIMKYTAEREGFVVPRSEILLLLKLGAFSERKESIKGDKDLIDLLGLLFFAGIDFKFLKDAADRYGLSEYLRLLLDALDGFDRSLIKYLNVDENRFSKLKKKFREKLLEIL